MHAIRAVDPEQPVYDVRTVSEVVERSTAQRWLNATLVTALAALSLLLASTGVYAVVATGVTRRRREFGIRLALGAAHSSIAPGAAGGDGLPVCCAAIGLVAAIILMKTMAGLLFGVTPGDPPSFAVGTGLLIAVTLLASYLPARRAASVDPTITLRST